MSTVNLSNLPATAASSSPTLEAVVVAVLLLLGQGTHSGKDHVQQQAGLREHSSSGSRQEWAFQGEKTPSEDRRGERCLVFLLLEQLIASFCSIWKSSAFEDLGDAGGGQSWRLCSAQGSPGFMLWEHGANAAAALLVQGLLLAPPGFSAPQEREIRAQMPLEKAGSWLTSQAPG